MKNTISYLLLFSLTFNLVAQDLPVEATTEFSYKNIREGKSALIPRFKEDDIARMYRGTKAINVLRKIITDKSVNRCATKVISAIESQLDLVSDKDVEDAILGLRLDDSIDDVSAGLLIHASKLSRPLANPIAKNELTDEEEAKAISIFSSKISDIKNKSLCIEDTYRSIYFSLVKESAKFGKHLKHLNKIAFDRDLISEAEFRRLETMRAGKVYEWPLSLSSYAQTLDTLAKRFPDRVKESSELITDNSEGKFRNKKSLRQSLHEKYNSTQIILLANMVRDLKKRLEASDISININYPDQPTEIISLSPMEKFRFILKLLRKELSTINNSSLLNGRSASYIDIITAAYEVGYISSAEIEQLAALEDIWNPKKTSQEKVMFWVKRFGGVASILLPPPFGFVSVMAIMLIDQYISQAPVDRDPDGNIF
ncbi:MAG: hypothetical protein WC635_10340 [Bacteriovorax sp.]|jgi:hypothetical protein